jgi:hypothetical protein
MTAGAKVRERTGELTKVNESLSRKFPQQEMQRKIEYLAI